VLPPSSSVGNGASGFAAGLTSWLSLLDITIVDSAHFAVVGVGIMVDIGTHVQQTAV
jgi:hypothetical protein